MAALDLSQQTLQPSPKVVTLTVAGEADAINSLRAEQFFEGVLEADQPRHVLLDLSGLTFAGSAFFSSLLFWREEMTKRGGVLVMYGLRPEIASTMRILTLDHLLTVRPDQQAALDALPRGA